MWQSILVQYDYVVKENETCALFSFCQDLYLYIPPITEDG